MKSKLRAVKPEDPDEPIDRYINEVNAGTISTIPYERLMIWYRKQKMYKEEVVVIDKAIATFRQFYADQQKQTLGRKISPALRALSNKISKSMGLHDRKGNALYLPEPLPKWIKRRDVASEKLRKQASPGTKKKAAKKKPVKKAAVKKKAVKKKKLK